MAVRLQCVISLVNAKSTGCPLEMYGRFGQKKKPERIHLVAASYVNTKQKCYCQCDLTKVQKRTSQENK